MLEKVLTYPSVKLWHSASQRDFKPVIPHLNHYLPQYEAR